MSAAPTPAKSHPARVNAAHGAGRVRSPPLVISVVKRVSPPVGRVGPVLERRGEVRAADVAAGRPVEELVAVGDRQAVAVRIQARSRSTRCRPRCARSGSCGRWRAASRCRSGSSAAPASARGPTGRPRLSRARCALSNCRITTCWTPLPRLHAASAVPGATAARPKLPIAATATATASDHARAPNRARTDIHGDTATRRFRIDSSRSASAGNLCRRGRQVSRDRVLPVSTTCEPGPGSPASRPARTQAVGA